MIDFDYWANLYKLDPKQFNRRKNQFLKEAANKLGQARILAKIKEQDKILASVQDPEARHRILTELFKADILAAEAKVKRCIKR